MRESDIPDLTFSMVKYGERETPWDLRTLLYQGGAGTNLRMVSDKIAQGALGAPILNRLPLVKKIHEVLTEKLVSGGSRSTAQGQIVSLRLFISCAEREGGALTLESAANRYVEWIDHLKRRKREVGDIGDAGISLHAIKVAYVLDRALELRSGLLEKAHLPKKPRKRGVLSVQADKQNLEQTFAFGHTLLDIIKSLSVEAIRGPLPCQISFRTGKLVNKWAFLKPPEKVKALAGKPGYAMTVVKNARAAWEADTSLRTRYALVNLRILAEMLVFISQTGMNISQVNGLKMGKFRYRSHLDGYQVERVYKGRRHGEVSFEIFSEYREIFERYLAWREAMFPGDGDGLLFPLVKKGGRAADVTPTFGQIQKMCKELGVSYFPPSALRKTRINWVLRQSQDLAMTAEMHAHTQETLIQYYEQPNLQMAMIEISRFHSCRDPAIAPPGLGVCIEAAPIAILGAPRDAPVPDCVSPSGCLFCDHQRDLDCEDHVWSLSSYRHFKSLELASYRLPAKGRVPISIVATIDRIAAKLKYFKESSEVRALWVGEASDRIEEGSYHPRWDGFIQLMEK